MLEKLFELYKQFKIIKKREDAVFSGGDREMFGSFAIAKAIERLAIAVEDIAPAIKLIADVAANPPMVVGEEEFEMSEDDLAKVKRALGQFGDDEIDNTDNDDAEVFVGDDEVPCDNCVDRCSNPDKEPCVSCEEGSNQTPDHE